MLWLQKLWLENPGNPFAHIHKFSLEEQLHSTITRDGVGWPEEVGHEKLCIRCTRLTLLQPQETLSRPK